ncbi:MAG TPA: hypothetical protein VK822_23645 [Acetobacteraceae bacterium]|jgi:prophage tail gpP-like protein|nr:hypothetical protein [Acetobacteraceae bacterium]
MAVEVSPISLDVAGRRFDGWLTVRIERSVENACIAFGFHATRTWPGMAEQWWIEPGDAVSVRLGDHILCVGWIDMMSPGYDGENHSIEISGRGRVCDLCDCSYVGPPWQWKNTNVADIITALADPFQITVVIDADLGAPMDFTIQQGEACYEAIDRICRLRQVLSYEQPDGSLLITRVSDAVCPSKLVLGNSIWRASSTLDDRDRFSHYIVKGQQKASDSTSPKQAAESIGTVTDPSMRRYRPKLMVQSANTDNGAALDRAKWEKQQRWGNARTAEITVAGLLQSNGEPWPINQLCDIEDAWLGLDRRLAITKTVLFVGNEGIQTTLTLQPPEALTPEPPSNEPSAKAKGDGAGGPDFWTQAESHVKAGEERRLRSKQ